MKYIVKGKDPYGSEWVEFETDNYQKAYYFVKSQNNKTCDYLQDCQEEYEIPGNSVWYKLERADTKIKA